nr:hypothetical protein [Phaeobacter sp.]
MQRFNLHNAPQTPGAEPLRADARFSQPTAVGGATGPGLVRSTLIAGASALVLLVGFVLPAEYDIDPTGLGGLLGLREMGEIKQQLIAEAAADAALDAAGQTASTIDPSALDVEPQ